jgi:hypothetical protein
MRGWRGEGNEEGKWQYRDSVVDDRWGLDRWNGLTERVAFVSATLLIVVVEWREIRT